MDLHAIANAHLGNLRDVGGGPTSDGGTVARGVAYRSAELADERIVDDPDLARLAVRTVVDLRTAAERDTRPDHVPAGADHVVLDVLADMPTSAAGRVNALFGDPGGLARALGGVDLAEQMRETYRQLVVSDSARRAYAAFVRVVVDPDRTPVLFHCTAGKDRTGWAATILLLAAGADEAAVAEEFLAVNPAVRATFAPLLAQLGEHADLVAPMLEVRADYLAAALAQVSESYGSFDAYLGDGLGLSDLEIGALRRTMRGD
ncbi:tyrosine-protein phosphatase [Cellulomonas sp. HZM]|uniref:tyrosine-protein phosphatase n=1 Tax=Cellulomonas sp. HZM TaxID=1454010 RepID=UPI000493203E|nr:tyrosine-protein phosphatase [Cellulomonas sp. HZM]